MNTLQLKQQSVDSWTVINKKTNALIAWITQLQNGTYQVVIRGEISRKFDVYDDYSSLNQVLACLKHYKIGGGV